LSSLGETVGNFNKQPSGYLHVVLHNKDFDRRRLCTYTEGACPLEKTNANRANRMRIGDSIQYQFVCLRFARVVRNVPLGDH